MRDDGNATVEFLLVAVLVVAVALGVIQLTLALHVRNVLISSAHEGAHVAALADRSLEDGAARTEFLVESALGGIPAEYTTSHVFIDGVPAVQVTVVASVPMVGMWGATDQRISAHALAEAPGG